jgi:hypothetical protein
MTADALIRFFQSQTSRLASLVRKTWIAPAGLSRFLLLVSGASIKLVHITTLFLSANRNLHAWAWTTPRARTISVLLRMMPKVWLVLAVSPITLKC